MTDDNILDHFEREKHIKLPAHIKHLLAFAGFDNKITLSKFELEDITELEKIGRDVIPRVFGRVEQEKYLGCFKDYAQGFCIFSGHKKLLLEMAQFYRSFSYKKRALVTESGETVGKKKIEEQRDVNGEKQNIYSLLLNWIGNFSSKYLSYEEAAHLNKEISKMKVDISHEDPNQCFITCCICLKELKIFRNQNGFWIMSNIHKHFKTHLNSSHSSRKFNKNISISSTISRELDSVYMAENNDVKSEIDLDENMQ